MPSLTWGWSDAVATYKQWTATWVDFSPMVELAEFIASSPYARGIFPTKSLHRLWIGRYKNFEPFDCMLQIEYDPHTRMLEFSYWNLWKGGQWVRQYHADEGIAVLEHFLLKDVRWFHKRVSPPEDER